jgi:hypothetical protein
MAWLAPKAIVAANATLAMIERSERLRACMSKLPAVIARSRP